MITPPRICLLLLIAAFTVSLILSARNPPQQQNSARLQNKSREQIAYAENDPHGLGWPNLFGPKHISVSTESNLVTTWPTDGPREKWRRKVGCGYSSPVCLGTKLFLVQRVEDEEFVECCDTDSGASIWQFRYPTKYQCRFNYSSGPYSTPVLDDRYVYAVSAEGTMRCLDQSNGRMIWQREFAKEYDLPEGLFAVGTSPLLEGDRLIFNLGGVDQNAGVIAVNKQNGETLWTATNQGASYATPIAATIHGRRIVFAVTFEGLVALDPNMGKVFWSIPFRPKGSQTVNATSPVVASDLVLMVTGPGPGSLCVRVHSDGSYEEVWRDRRVLDSQFNNLTYLDGHVYGYTSSRQGGATLNCVEMETGTLRWQHQSKLGRGSLLAVDGQIILWGEHGHLGSIDINPDRPIQRSMTTSPLLDAPCYSAPALHRGLLYLRNESSLLCLELRQSA